jgi:ABC-type uncharacterized transport system ATPase subunit
VVSADRLGGNGVVELTIADKTDPQTVMREIMNTHSVRSIALRRPTLTDVFVQLVSEDQGEQAAAQAREELSIA